jgi:hypothetical protein
VGEGGWALGALKALAPTGVPGYFGCVTRTAAGIIAGVAAVFVAIALIAGGGGGRGGVLDPVAKAADTTAAAGSAEFGLAGSVTAGGQTVPLSGSGKMDTKNQKVHMSIATTVPGAGPMTIEEILDGTVIYMKFPQLAGQMPGGKQWMKLDLQEFGKSLGVDFQKLMGASRGNTNPADFLSYLKAVGNSQVVGRESIRGVSTTHYRATIDLQKALDEVGDKRAKQALKQLYSSSGATAMPVDAWVDREGLVRRESFQMAMSPPGAGRVSMNMTFEFIRFGVPVDANPPPDDQVFDVTSLAGSVLPKDG